MIKGAAMRLKLWIAAVLVACPSFVFGQGAVLQGGPWTAGHVPMYAGGSTSQNVVMDGGGAAGGTTGTTLGEIGITSRSSTNTYPSATSGGGQLGAHFCMYDAPTTNATGYHFLCLDPNAQGGPLIASGAGGGASNLPFTFNVNGTSYAFPFSTSGVIGPGTTVVGDTACWNNTVGTLLKSCPPFPGTSVNATATTFSAANQALWLVGTYTGTGSGPYAEFSITDTATNTTLGQALSGVRIDYNFGGTGTGAGNRTGLLPIMNMTGPTPGTNDDLKFYAPFFSQGYFYSSDGGTGSGAGNAHGNMYGGAMLAQAMCFAAAHPSVCATHLNGITGAEIDVSAQAGTSVDYKHVLTLIGVNSDAVQGTIHDSMLNFARDNTTTTGFRFGIAFAREDSTWPIDATGTMIGSVVPGTGARTAAKGVDWTGITFSDSAFRSTGFAVDGTGQIFSTLLRVNVANPQWIQNDLARTVTTGGLTRIIGTGGITSFEINTAAGGDFSTTNVAFAIPTTGIINFPIGATTTTITVTPVAVGALATCNSGAKGKHSFVTDSNATLTAGIGAVVAAGGANNVPVVCDGTNWRIG